MKSKSNHHSLYQSYTTTSTHLGEESDYLKQSYEYLVKRYLLPSFPAKKKSDLRILDVACGWGGVLQVLHRQGWQNISGFDLSPEQISQAKSSGLDHVQVADALEFFTKSKSESYDVILMIDIIEHFPASEAVELMKLVYKTLAPGGTVILQVPNGMSLISLNFYNDLTHYKAYTVNSLNQLARMAGFESKTRYTEVRPYLMGKKKLLSNGLWNLLIKPLTRLYLLAVVGNSAGKVYTPNIMGYWRKK